MANIIGEVKTCETGGERGGRLVATNVSTRVTHSFFFFFLVKQVFGRADARLFEMARHSCLINEQIHK